ncbi:DUF1127 domain-containing protein [Methylobacterium frigidaeris]|uniref:YjiS-like domain-containing protein n=1 Tax=Methylobacterium frigidaeris TaxID=2038277 RepID=A0AA37HAV1_9HYPH|nr:DUF1127 domain-containing protein [Methylobacterium frigidaeris]PIK71557.1 hypothetical protein CS379_18675 [Methylobacterium frigidaeris]GJD62459.1 hypothetical protein MPEAHAMD_2612 [Methylobacterium frigidaeris]
MTISFAPLFGVLSLALGSGRKAAQIVARIVILWTHRRAAYRLAELDDRALKDIGLTRSDVLGVLDLPFRHDPTVPLVHRRRARRQPPPPAVSVRLAARDGRAVEGRGCGA